MGSERRGGEGRKRKKEGKQEKRWRERKAGETESERRLLHHLTMLAGDVKLAASSLVPHLANDTINLLCTWVRQEALWGPSEVAYPKQEVLQMASLHRHLREVKGPGKFPSSIHHLAQRDLHCG